MTKRRVIGAEAPSIVSLHLSRRPANGTIKNLLLRQEFNKAMLDAKSRRKKQLFSVPKKLHSAFEPTGRRDTASELNTEADNADERCL